jgi:tRNA (mo5U34)-methyltransferase
MVASASVLRNRPDRARARSQRRTPRANGVAGARAPPLTMETSRLIAPSSAAPLAGVDPSDADAVRARVHQLGPWFHNLDLRGVPTAPRHFLGDYPAFKWRRFSHAIPADLRGRTVLDVGCNAGFYAMEMKRRGADRVVAIDSEDFYLTQARFAAAVNGLEIEFHNLSVYDVGALGERFDLVIFMGVFYHLRHPLLALDLLYEHAVGDLLLFQTMQRGTRKVKRLRGDYAFVQTRIFDAPGFPRMNFIEHRYSGDQSNWWAPNRAGTEAMLRSAGFRILQHPEREVYLCGRGSLPDSLPRAVYPARGGEGG